MTEDTLSSYANGLQFAQGEQNTISAGPKKRNTHDMGKSNIRQLHELERAAKRGDQAAQSELITRYRGDMRRVEIGLQHSAELDAPTVKMLTIARGVVSIKLREFEARWGQQTRRLDRVE